MRIPTVDKKIIVSNKSDLYPFGNIEYTRNIDLSSPGYIKLSSRSVSIESQSSVSNLRLPLAFGRESQFSIGDSVDFAITQSGQKGYWLTILESGITLNVDDGTNAPTLTEDSHGAWYRNLWHVTSDTDFWSKADVTDVATYTDRGNLTSGKVHFVEPFKSRSTVCVTNGNEVKQFDSSYTETTKLTLTTDYEAVALSYSNYQMGVICMNSDSASGQNQDSLFFVWDGTTTSAGQGIPIGSDKAIAIAPYRGTWVVLTREGEFKVFTGGGFQTLTALPIYYKKIIWGLSTTRDLLGDVMKVEGDRIYLNFNGLVNEYGKNYEQVLPDFRGGVLVYDPSVGIYNRYTPSISPLSMIKVQSSGVNTTTDIMTLTALTGANISDDIPPTGSQIKYISDTSNLIGGLKTPRIYYVIRHTATTFSLAETYQDAIDGNKINLTSTGASNNYFLGLTTLDYGQSYANKCGAIAFMGKYSPIHDHIIYGAELNDATGTGNSNHLQLTVPDFESRGCFVTTKEMSDNVTDIHQKLFVKYKPLKVGDSIIVKYKNRELVGLPVSTPQGSGVNQCSWTSTTTFTTTADLEDAKTAFDAGTSLECEIIAGAGAGVMAQISSITYNAGTYTVTLEESVEGASSGRYCDIIIDNWTVLGTITSDDTEGYKHLPIGSQSKFYKFKVELRGSDVTIEDIQPVTTVNQPTK
jgi:hypothetical protein